MHWLGLGIGYVLGNFQTAFIVGKFYSKIDIRDHGSGNAGTTNVMRVLGWKAGLITFLGDFLKAVLAVLVCQKLFGDVSAFYAGLGVVVGHNWPAVLKFKGGKGIASSVGALAGIDFTIGLLFSGILLLVILITRYVSLGSVISAISLPILFYFLDGSTLSIPNAGKSSLLNKIIGEERAIVSDIAGTTRDAIDTPFEKDGQKYVLIDTAGLRKKNKVYENIEKYSVFRSEQAVERADVCVIMIDASEGITEQDTKVAGIAHDSGKACIIIVNKWDLIAKDNSTYNEFKKRVQETFAYMSYAPIEFISAKTGQRLDKLLDLIKFVSEQHAKRIGTGMLNDVLIEATAMNQPPSDKGKRLKIYYMTQSSVKPPTFVLFVNDAELLHFSYQRYIENQIRNAFDFRGTPIHFIVRERGKE